MLFSSDIQNLKSQDIPNKPPPIKRISAGIGMGLDYGGFGTRLTFMGTDRLCYFAAIGYNMLGPGINGGLDIRLRPQSRLCPYTSLMYGYNAVIVIKGAYEFEKTYYGLTWKTGIEYWSKRSPGFLNIGLLIPFRTAEFHDKYRTLVNSPNIEMDSVIPPIGVSLGYHIVF